MKAHHERHLALRRKTGFSLIELMVTVAIVAILATIAYPSFIEQIRKSRRADAKTALTQTVQNIERAYTMSNNYASAVSSIVGASGVTSSEGYYLVQEDPGTPSTSTTFALQAVPQGTQASDAKCGTFTLNSVGEKDVTGTLSKDLCW